MASDDRIKSILSLFILGILIALFCSGCSPLSPQVTPTPTRVVSQQIVETAVPILSCPDEKTLYNLWLSHLAVLDVDAGDGEKFYIEWNNIPPSYFQLWIEPSGTISTELIINITEISYHGEATHPNNDDCPIQTFDGVWEMSAKISGRCENDVVYLHIVEEWIDPELHSDCGDAAGPGSGLYSAPELDLVFNLNEEFPADGITIPEGGPFHASYDYHLYPMGFDLPPLVPE